MKVITLNKKEFKEKCQQLFSKIDSDFDLVIGILNGGGFVLEEYKKLANTNILHFRTLKIQRKSSISLKTNSVLKFLLKIMPYSVLNIARLLEFKLRKIKSSNTSRNKTINFSLEAISIINNQNSIKRILILDDALDTGNIMQNAVDIVRNEFPDADIKTAVVVWTNKTSVFKPTYYLNDNILFRFPWSIDYKAKL